MEASGRVAEFQRKYKTQNVIQNYVQHQYAEPEPQYYVPAFLQLVRTTPDLTKNEEALKSISSFGVLLREQKDKSDAICHEIASLLTPEHVGHQASSVGMEFLVRVMHFARTPRGDDLLRGWYDSVKNDPAAEETKILLETLLETPRQAPFDWLCPPFHDFTSFRENVFLQPSITYDISPFLQKFKRQLLKQCDLKEAADSDKFRIFAWICGCNYVDLLWSYYYTTGDDEFLRRVTDIVLYSRKRDIIRDDNEQTLVAWMNTGNFLKLQEDFSFDRDSHVNIAVSQYALRSLMQHGLAHNLVGDIIQTYQEELEDESQIRLMKQTFEALKFISRGPGFKREEIHEQSFEKEDDW